MDTTERLHFHFSLSCIGEGNGKPLQRSWLENPRDGGAWWAAVYGIAQSETLLKRLSSSSSSCPRDSLESSPAPWFKIINSLVLSLLYGPTLTPICDYWKIHSFDYMDLCCQWCLCTTFVIAFHPRSKCLLISSCTHHLWWFWSSRK